MTEQELKNEIKLEKFRRVYLIFGEDNYLKNHYAKLIAEKSASVMPDMNLIKIDGKKASLQKIYDETEQLPCMAEYRCIVLNDYNYASLGDKDAEEFINIVSELPESTVLVLLCDAIEINPKKAGKWQKLIKTAEKCGGVLNCEHMSVSALQNMMIRSAEKRKVMLDLTTAKYMIECCGREIGTLKGEIEKLCSYKANDRITKEDIDKLCAKSVDANKYQLSKLILSCNLPGALKMIGDLFDMRMSEIEISMLIIGGFVDIYRVKMMVSAGVSPKEAAADLGYKGREFVLTNSARTANSISTQKLRECLEILNDNDIKLKSTSDDKRFLLEQTVIKLIRTLKD